MSYTLNATVHCQLPCHDSTSLSAVTAPSPILVSLISFTQRHSERTDSHRSFSSLPPFELNALRPATNSSKSTVPDPLFRLALALICLSRLSRSYWRMATSGEIAHSSSKIAIIRCASGLLAIWGICRNSSLSIVPEPSLSSFMNRFFRRCSSGAETTDQSNTSGDTFRAVAAVFDG